VISELDMNRIVTRYGEESAPAKFLREFDLQLGWVLVAKRSALPSLLAPFSGHTERVVYGEGLEPEAEVRITESACALPACTVEGSTTADADSFILVRRSDIIAVKRSTG